MAFFLWPFSFLYFLFSETRNFFYDHGIFRAKSVGRPVVAVGNITAGGTGKTPMVVFLFDLLKKSGRKPAVLLRGYKGEQKGPAVVPVDGDSSENAQSYGDEAAMYAALPALVGVGGDRIKSAELVLERDGGVDVFLADDAFQHRRLHRDLNILLVDATRPQSELHCLPQGRGREAWPNIRRADLIFLTKCNLADAGNILNFEKKIGEITSAPVIPMNFFLEAPVAFFDRKRTQPVDKLKNARSVLLSGLGNPQAFEQSVTVDYGVKVIRHFIFPDHHRFSLSEIGDVIEFCLDSEISSVFVSEKDAVRLPRFESRGIDFWITRLEVDTNQPQHVEIIHERIRGIL